eukprot:CAMPEP_0183374516 /NCGR_PEP_ID=MMETSP0164_2-20130417/114712_1 /TAXON_ID=221442 /ORGANISM="Coccolithus pelagicus ssp braarudi, Strain PLY182g" /LENGTH=122 /DNA_ID=CAMNT_0025551561 /DNA_START=88 /DNA_END=457 /DNA_ORIENTATION=-
MTERNRPPEAVNDGHLIGGSLCAPVDAPRAVVGEVVVFRHASDLEDQHVVCGAGLVVREAHQLVLAPPAAGEVLGVPVAVPPQLPALRSIKAHLWGVVIRVAEAHHARHVPVLTLTLAPPVT